MDAKKHSQDVKMKNDKTKLTKKDKGFLEDAITVISNLLHIELHSTLEYIRTQNNEWLEINNVARKDRTELLDAITSENITGEEWCFYKHSLICYVGFIELGNRAYSVKQIKLAEHYFNKAGSYLVFVLSKLEEKK